MSVRFHHIGFVVQSIDAQVQGFIASLRAEWDGRIIHDPIQKVRVTFLRTANDPAGVVELVEPASDDAPVQRFIAKSGGGLHHLCYEVDDLEAELARMRSLRAVVVKKPQPAVAFDGRRIAWVSTAERLLVEYLESER